MKTKLEIIEETVAFYSEDPSRRAFGPLGSCVYYDPVTGNKCGLGRCMDDNFLLANHESLNVTGSADEGLLEWLQEIYNRSLDDILKPEYRGHDLTFWQRVQDIHDLRDHWNEQGFTEKGRQYVDAWSRRLSTESA